MPLSWRLPLLVSSARNPVPESVAAALSLSVSGIAFLAGYGIESVFNMLEGLVNRVFVAQQPQR
jgi:hypothetical protein